MAKKKKPGKKQPPNIVLIAVDSLLADHMSCGPTGAVATDGGRDDVYTLNYKGPCR